MTSQPDLKDGPPECEHDCDCASMEDVAREVLCRVFDADMIHEFHEWYKSSDWLWWGRGLGAFIYGRLRVVPPEGGPRDNYVGIDNELEWRREQMAHWPRNRHGSLLTQGEYDALTAGGQPPSDGMPSEPSEEAVAAFLEFTDADRPDPGTHREWSIPDDVDNHLRAALRAAYAAERGVSAVPPTEEPNE